MADFYGQKLPKNGQNRPFSQIRLAGAQTTSQMFLKFLHNNPTTLGVLCIGYDLSSWVVPSWLKLTFLAGKMANFAKIDFKWPLFRKLMSDLVDVKLFEFAIQRPTIVLNMTKTYDQDFGNFGQKITKKSKNIKFCHGIWFLLTLEKSVTQSNWSLSHDG